MKTGITYIRSSEDNQARRAEIVRLYLQKNPKLCMREIGLKLDPQITAQAVWKVLKKEGVTR